MLHDQARQRDLPIGDVAVDAVGREMPTALVGHAVKW
jgi:hypothetical protein